MPDDSDRRHRMEPPGGGWTEGETARPLEPGEYVDLDSGLRVKRLRPGTGTISVEGSGGSVGIPIEEVLTIAALAGVIDDEREPAP